MDKYELSKHDFDTLQKALRIAIVMAPMTSPAQATPVEVQRMRDLRDRFYNAHTGWLETEQQ